MDTRQACVIEKRGQDWTRGCHGDLPVWGTQTSRLLGTEDLDNEEGPHLTLGTARREERRGRRGAEQRPDLLTVAPASGTPEAPYYPHRDTDGRGNTCERKRLRNLTPESVTRRIVWGGGVASVEDDPAVLHPFQPTKGDRNTEDGAAEGVEHLVPTAGRPAVHDPVLLPDALGTWARSSACFSHAHSFARKIADRAWMGTR